MATSDQQTLPEAKPAFEPNAKTPNSMKLTAWWGIPCKSMVPVFREIALMGHDVHFVSIKPMSFQRTSLGWTVPEHDPMPLTILDEGWREAVTRIMEGRDGLHIFNGIWHEERIRAAIAEARGLGRAFGLIMEAPANLERGWRRLAKHVVAPWRARLLAGQIPVEARFVLSASGDCPDRFVRLGFPRERIHRFGYFPNFPPLRDGPRKPGPLRLLCIGYLEPFKGQDLLIAAIAMLKNRGIDAECTITGFGSTRETLERQAAELQVADRVRFAGVVDQPTLHTLFAESDALVAPGYEEPWGIRVNEALLAGLPVIVSDRVGAQELIAASEAGAAFRSGSPGALVDAVAGLARQVADNRAELLRKVDDMADRIRPARAAAYAIDVFAHALAGCPAPMAPPWSEEALASDMKAA